ncbi:M23 family metallopeptidase [Geodermatophilus ruber]|uniref:Peptidase family M23 n=1 Tax=Geodermatophilus ruber TaxID=504800 RepID=A0A1I4BL16_9ACTN|nr:M23 family metallopeptidase [Geodermatophilus ruber]SFK68897.1 Peptidase family M23 [Geodermatophilus ruber]
MPERVEVGSGTVRARITVGVGRRFLPLPRAQLLRGGGDGRVAVIPAAPGTPVHAVSAGQVADVDGRGGVALSDEDGAAQHYAGLDPARVTVAVDTRVRAGGILGAVGEESRIEIRLSDASGDPLDAVEALIGLPDPNELGFQPVGEGLGVDPDALDRELVPTDPFGEPP